jgi:hypothetical protein
MRGSLQSDLVPSTLKRRGGAAAAFWLALPQLILFDRTSGITQFLSF